MHVEGSGYIARPGIRATAKQGILAYSPGDAYLITKKYSHSKFLVLHRLTIYPSISRKLLKNQTLCRNV